MEAGPEGPGISPTPPTRENEPSFVRLDREAVKDANRKPSLIEKLKSMLPKKNPKPIPTPTEDLQPETTPTT